MTGLILLTLDILEKQGPILDQPPGKVKEACLQINVRQELKGRNGPVEKYQDTA